MRCCSALMKLSYATLAVVDDGGVVTLVAAMEQHAADAELQRYGCGALMNLSFSDAARTQAIVSAGGVAAIVAAIVAAMSQHTADAEAQRNGCGALANLAFDVAVFKQASVDAGGRRCGGGIGNATACGGCGAAALRKLRADQRVLR